MTALLHTPASTSPSQAISAKSAAFSAKEPVLDLSDLPFVKELKKSKKRANGSITKRSFWHFKSSRDLDADCRLAKAYADMLLDYLQQDDFTPVFGWVIMDMAEAGINLPETAFLQRISERLAA